MVGMDTFVVLQSSGGCLLKDMGVLGDVVQLFSTGLMLLFLVGIGGLIYGFVLKQSPSTKKKERANQYIKGSAIFGLGGPMLVFILIKVFEAMPFEGGLGSLECFTKLSGKLFYIQPIQFGEIVASILPLIV